MVTIRHERPGEAAAREALLDASYGPVRFTKTSERLREGRLPELSLVAADGRRIVGSVRLWPVSAGRLEPERGLLLLGPLAVASDCPQARHRLDARATGAARSEAARPWRRAAGRRRALLRAVRLLQREDRRALAAGAVRTAPAAWRRARSRRTRRRPGAGSRQRPAGAAPRSRHLARCGPRPQRAGPRVARGVILSSLVWSK